jgi:hypothetical protein
MPRAFDQQQIAIDRNPLLGLTQDYGKLPKLNPLDPAGILDIWIKLIKDSTGVDLSGLAQQFDFLGQQINPLVGLNEVWQDLLDGINAAFTPLGEEFSATVADVVASIEGILNIGRNAALSAANANISAEITSAELAGGGGDEFDYSSANTLPVDVYERSTGGPGSGNYGPSGSGYLVWKPSGAATREIIYRRLDDTLSDDDAVVTVVWSTKPNPALFPKTYGYICGRMANTTNNTHVRAKISDNDCRIEAVVSGTATQIGSTVSLTVNDGDVFKFYLGHPDHPRRFWLQQNGVTVLTADDGSADGSGAVSQRGSAYRSAGFGCIVESYLLLSQNPAPSLAGWTWAPQSGGS